MATKLVQDSSLTSIANAIRTKGGTSASLEFPTGFVTAINNISGGGGGSANIESLSITQNGTYTASGGVDGYSPVTVNVSGGGIPYPQLTINLTIDAAEYMYYIDSGLTSYSDGLFTMIEYYDDFSTSMQIVGNVLPDKYGGYIAIPYIQYVQGGYELTITDCVNCYDDGGGVVYITDPTQSASCSFSARRSFSG